MCSFYCRLVLDLTDSDPWWNFDILDVLESFTSLRYLAWCDSGMARRTVRKVLSAIFWLPNIYRVDIVASKLYTGYEEESQDDILLAQIKSFKQRKIELEFYEYHSTGRKFALDHIENEFDPKSRWKVF